MEDGEFTSEVLNDIPIIRGSKVFVVPESLVKGMSIHRLREPPTAVFLVDSWLEGDDYDYGSRYDDWVCAAEKFLRSATYDQTQHLSLLVRAFERFLQKNDLV